MIYLLAILAFFQEPWGKDAELIQKVPPPTKKEAPSLFSQAAHEVIQFHQSIISPAQGNRSHFYPSSSQYMKEAIARYGFTKGFIMGCDRLLRENDEAWVYRTIENDGRILKYDPAKEDKYN